MTIFDRVIGGVKHDGAGASRAGGIPFSRSYDVHARYAKLSSIGCLVNLKIPNGFP